MTLNEYQHQAMSTCMESCRNIAYMLTGLNAEVGEVNDKIAKQIRKGQITIHRNDLVSWQTLTNYQEFITELKKELGDCLWFIAGLSTSLGYSLEDVAEANIAKLQDRVKRNVIDGNGDNR